MLITLLGIVGFLLITWALIYPGGPLGYYLLYRVSRFLAKSIDGDSNDHTHIDGFGALCVTVPNKAFWINHQKRTHHLLLEQLAKAVAPQVGYRNGVARVDEDATFFRFSGSQCKQ